MSYGLMLLDAAIIEYQAALDQVHSDRPAHFVYGGIALAAAKAGTALRQIVQEGRAETPPTLEDSRPTITDSGEDVVIDRNGTFIAIHAANIAALQAFRARLA